MIFKKVLFVGAHPDDEIACSGLISVLDRHGAHIDAVAFSDCADFGGGIGSDLEKEYQAAWALFGVRPHELGRHPNQRLSEVRQSVLQYLVDMRNGYDLVLLPATSDCHQDHSVVREEGIRAFKHTTILGYEHPQNSVRAVPMQCYVALDDDDMLAKQQHAATYKTQAHRTYMDPAFIEGTARMRGVQAGTEYAEALEVVRWMM